MKVFQFINLLLIIKLALLGLTALIAALFGATHQLVIAAMCTIVCSIMGMELRKELKDAK